MIEVLSMTQITSALNDTSDALTEMMKSKLSLVPTKAAKENFIIDVTMEICWLICLLKAGHVEKRTNGHQP